MSPEVLEQSALLDYEELGGLPEIDPQVPTKTYP